MATSSDPPRADGIVVAVDPSLTAPWAVVPPFAVDRPDLVDRLERALTRPLVLIVAPAGHGKSVLLAQWATAHPERRVAWLSARGVGADASLFARRFHGALWEVGSGRLLARRGFAADSVLDQLADLGELVVVIDDFEELTAPVILADLGRMVEELPSGVRLVLLSRRDPDIALHRGRLRDQVDEIRQDDLHMSPEEVAVVVDALADCQLRADQAVALADRTEGWPAGVQLAALALRDREDVDRYVEEFSGGDRHVADYLSDEVLDGLEPADRQFLLDTSVLDHLDGPLCDALTGRNDGQQVLESLHRRAMFLADEGERGRYRYHGLFRDLLRFELRTDRPGDEVGLHRRAAAAYLDRDRPADAARHLVAAEDWSAVIALADANWRRFLERGDVHVVLSWLEQLPVPLVERDPVLALTIARLRVLAGYGLAGEALAEQTAARHDLSPALERRVDLVRALLVFQHGTPRSVLAAAERILDDADGSAEVLEGEIEPLELDIAARLCAGRAELLLGHLGAARGWLAGIDDPRHPLESVRLLGTSAYVDALGGHLVRAERQARRALAIAEETGVQHHAGCAQAHLALARVLVDRHEVAEAEPHLAMAHDLAVDKRSHALVAAQRVERGAWLIASGQADLVAPSVVESSSAEPPSAPLVATMAVVVQARAALALGRPDRAAALLDEVVVEVADVASVRAGIAAAERDLACVQKVVDNWPALDADEPRSTAQRELWHAVALDGQGDLTGAGNCIDAALALTEQEGMVQVLRDGGQLLGRALRRHHEHRPTPYLRRQIDLLADVPAATASPELVDQLSERELEVLRYLPGRLSNAEIADRLFVSVNTLKTHLKAIYRKLDATSRSEAVERGEELGLA